MKNWNLPTILPKSHNSGNILHIDTYYSLHVVRSGIVIIVLGTYKVQFTITIY